MPDFESQHGLKCPIMLKSPTQNVSHLSVLITLGQSLRKSQMRIEKKYVSPRVRLKKEAQNANSVDKLRKIVGVPVDNNNYLCDTNFLR